MNDVQTIYSFRYKDKVCTSKEELISCIVRDMAQEDFDNNSANSSVNNKSVRELLSQFELC